MIIYLSRKRHAGVAELADALDSGSSGSNLVEVQVLSPALFLCLALSLSEFVLKGIFFALCQPIANTKLKGICYTNRMPDPLFSSMLFG